MNKRKRGGVRTVISIEMDADIKSIRNHKLFFSEFIYKSARKSIKIFLRNRFVNN